MKSDKVYAILISDKTEFRDKFLSELLETDYTPVVKGGKFISSFDIRPKMPTSFYKSTDRIGKSKIWKTYAGIKRVYDNLKPRDQDRFEIVEVTDLWNSDIDCRVKIETDLYNKKVAKLLNQKV